MNELCWILSFTQSIDILELTYHHLLHSSGVHLSVSAPFPSFNIWKNPLMLHGKVKWSASKELSCTVSKLKRETILIFKFKCQPMFLFEENNGKWFCFVLGFFPLKQRNIKYGLNLDCFSNMCNAESMLSGTLRAACPPFAVSAAFQLNVGLSLVTSGQQLLQLAFDPDLGAFVSVQTSPESQKYVWVRSKFQWLAEHSLCLESFYVCPNETLVLKRQRESK